MVTRFRGGGRRDPDGVWRPPRRRANWPLRAGIVLLIATAGVAGVLLGTGVRGPKASVQSAVPAPGPASRQGPTARTAGKPGAPAGTPAQPATTGTPNAEATATSAGPRPSPALALGPVPNPELVARSATGPLPVIGKNGLDPWHAYARPFHDPSDLPRVALVIESLGMDRGETNAAIEKLPAPVTLAFSPYAENLQSWVAKARAFGHEVMLQLPMQPLGYPANDPGPNALLTSLSEKQNLARLDWLLSRFTGYVGVTDYHGGAFTSSAISLMPVLREIKARGLIFLDSPTAPGSVAAPLAREIGLPLAVNDNLIDRTPSQGDIAAALSALQETARKTGAAVGTGLPYPVTVDAIDAWAAKLAQAGIELAPVSAIAKVQKTE